MLKIEVTADDIANGIPDNCDQCPIALAMKRTIVGIEEIDVDGDASWVAEDGAFSARFPDLAKQFIHDFDDGEPVEPFAFECEPRERRCCDYGDDD